MRKWLWVYLGLVVVPWAAGCGEADTAELGFVLVRHDDLRADGLPLRATGLDREHVARAECEVLLPNGTALARLEAEVDLDIPEGEQELRLKVPAGEGYFARILGYTADDEVWECGVTGPFDLERGAKLLVTIVIDLPEEQDADCDKICTGHEDCQEIFYCPSPCVNDPSAEECTEALCRWEYIGEPCAIREDCGQGLSCLTDWPGGYCSKTCTQDDFCPGRSLCSTSHPRYCVRTCEPEDAAGCREADEYECRDAGDGRSACLPL